MAAVARVEVGTCGNTLDMRSPIFSFSSRLFTIDWIYLTFCWSYQLIDIWVELVHIFQFGKQPHPDSGNSIPIIRTINHIISDTYNSGIKLSRLTRHEPGEEDTMKRKYDLQNDAELNEASWEAGKGAMVGAATVCSLPSLSSISSSRSLQIC